MGLFVGSQGEPRVVSTSADYEITLANHHTLVNVTASAAPRAVTLSERLTQVTLELEEAGELLVTSMDGDGTQAGYDLELTSTIADAVSVPVIASGGVGTLDHLVEGVTKGHASAVLAASIFHFGTYTIAQAHAALRAAGLPARG